MGLPSAPVTLPTEEIKLLNEKLSTLRHNINNHLSLIVAASELIRHRPEMAARMAATVSEQPDKIIAEMTRFSSEFEQALGITRD